MEEKKAKKKNKKFTISMQANLLLVFCVVIVLFVALIGRIFYLNYSVGDRYQKRVLSQQTYMSNAIAYKRGSILDRNGTVLAESIRVYNIIIDCNKMLTKEEYVEPTIKAMVDCFDADEQEIRDILRDKPNSQYVIYAKSVAAEKVDLFKTMEDENEDIQGVWFESDYKRVYPYNTLACDTIGFALPGTSTGMESFYNKELTGVNGREYGYFDSDLKLDRTVKDAEDGNTIVSTIDANIQQIVEKHIAKFNKETGSKNTAVLVMNPKNGEIYAMSSEKDYDLNNPMDLSNFFPKKKLDKMSDEKKIEELNKIWRNFVVSDAYEPGSTYKPVTVASALEEGDATDKSTYYCGGGYHVGKKWIRCASKVGHGTITLGESLMYSCNAALMQMAEKMGREKFYKDQVNFMFGSKTGIDLPAEASGIVFRLEDLNPQELATSSFGQSTKVTMLQIASAISSLVNGGNYYEPHVLKQIESSKGAVISRKEPVLVTKTVSEETSQLIRKYMLDTVENGTATAAQVEGYEIGGKTGTAEKYPRGNKKYLVSFIGAAPALDPEVIIYVLVDEPNVEDQAHSTFASGLFSEIAKDVYPFLDIEKTKKTTAEKTKQDTTNKPQDENSKKPDDQSGNETSEDEKNEDGAEEQTKPGKKNPTVGDETGLSEGEEGGGGEIPAAPEEGDSNIRP